MLIEPLRARREINRRLEAIGYALDHDARDKLNLGIKRDIQAKQLPPNVKVPSRRRPLQYVHTVHGATGSVWKSLLALLSAGSWTSSGGSFRLAESLGIDLGALVASGLVARPVTFLEVGAGWAGFHPHSLAARLSDNIAGLARRHEDVLGDRLHLHFTNLTKWQTTLPAGVTEHPFTTAAGILILKKEGVAPASVDFIYSQAAAYFEPDIEAFVIGAAELLRPRGLLLFNHKIEDLQRVRDAARRAGLNPSAFCDMGGMNGRVASFIKAAPREVTLSRPLADREPLLLDHV